MSKRGAILMICLSAIASLTLTAASPPSPRAENAAAVPKLTLPGSGYVAFNNLKDLEIDPGKDAENASDDVLYLLDGAYLGKPARIVVYGEGRVKDSFAVEGKPVLLARYGSRLYLYDDDVRAITAYENGVKVTGLPAEFSDIRSKGMTVSGSRLYVSAGESLRIFDLDTGEELASVGAGMNEAGNPAVYMAGNNSYLLYSDECRPSYGIHSYGLTDGSTRHLNCDTLVAKPYSVAAGNNVAFVSDAAGIHTMDLAGSPGSFLSLLPADPKAEIAPGSLRQATAMRYLPALGQLYVADAFSAAVQRFRVEKDGRLVFDEVFLASFGSLPGRLNAPTDLQTQGNRQYVLDAGNARIQTIGPEGISELSLREAGITATAERIAVNSDGIYVSTPEAVSLLDGEGRLTATFTAEKRFTALSASNGGVYAADGSRVRKLSPSGSETLLTLDGDARVLAINADLKQEYLYLATETGVLVRGIRQPEFSRFLPLPGIVDADMDFRDTLFTLTEDGISKVRFDGSAFTISGQQADILHVAAPYGEISVSTPAAIAVDSYGGEVLLLYRNDHLAAKFPKAVLGAVTETDVPEGLEPPLNILDKAPGDGKALPGVLRSWPSTIIYPVHADFVGTQNYPAGFCYEGEPTFAEDNTRVLILAEVSNYYYILHNNRAGFVLKNNVGLLAELAPPYTDALVLHDKANVYKYPSAVKDGDNYAFKCGELTKNTPLTLLNKVADFKDSSGISWYKVSYGGAFGYISRENVTQNVKWDATGNEKFGKIKADIAAGTVTVFTDDTHSSLFADGTRVKILKEEGDKLLIQGEDVGGELITGYVDRKYVTFDALTTSQIVGLILLGSVVVLLLAALILYRIFKAKKTGQR